MDKKYCVYKHTNKVNNKVYIGITCQKPEKRWDSGWGYMKQEVFFNAIKKYGWNGFTHEILFDGLTQEEAAQKEIELIAFYKSNCQRYQSPTYGYNATDGGDITFGGRHKEIAQYDLEGNLIRVWFSVMEAANECKMSYDTLQAHLAKRTGRAGKYMWYYVDGEVPEKVQSYKEKMGKVKPPKEPYKPGVRVAQYDLEGNLIRVWDSITEAGKEYGTDANICKCANGNAQTAYNFIWRKIDGEVEQKIKVSKLSNQIKGVAQYDKNGNFIRRFESITEASKETKVNGSHISGVCKGKRNSAGGYIWRYEE